MQMLLFSFFCSSFATLLPLLLVQLSMCSVRTDKNRFLCFCCASCTCSQASQPVYLYIVQIIARKKNLFIGFNFALIFHFCYADACYTYSSAKAQQPARLRLICIGIFHGLLTSCFVSQFFFSTRFKERKREKNNQQRNETKTSTTTNVACSCTDLYLICCSCCCFRCCSFCCCCDCFAS